ncbi:MAG: hypothetical protein ACWA5W_10360 [Phycisphaerales bacterium]
MPFYEVAGHDTQTHKPRTLRISARNDQEAKYTALEHGITEVKLHPYSDREMLLMDMKCFLYADPQAPEKAKKQRLERQYPKSILFDHPFLIITSSVFVGIMLARLAEALLAKL